jgi:recombination protein RecT
MAASSKPEPSNAVARQDANRTVANAGKRDKVESFRSSLVKFEPTIASVLPEYVKPERVIALTLTAATKNPKLFDCSMESIALSLIQVAQWDLEIGTTAHLVPFGNTCTAIADWKGLVKLMIRSGHVKDVKARASTRTSISASSKGCAPILEHVPSYDATTRGELMAFYAVAFLARGGGTFEVMTKDDVTRSARARIPRTRTRGTITTSRWGRRPRSGASRSGCRRRQP